MKQKGTYSSRLRFDSSIFGFLINLYLLPLGELAPTKFYIAFILISRCSSKKKKNKRKCNERYKIRIGKEKLPNVCDGKWRLM